MRRLAIAGGVFHIVPGIPIHLNPAGDYAETVLLPGDPGRALAIAQAIIESPKMVNTTRGLWGYSGSVDGVPVSVQSTGIGGPSAAIVVEELIDLGARTLVRVGTCGSLVSALGLGDLVVAHEVLAADGTSRALGADSHLAADPELTERLAVVAGTTPATIASTDLFYDDREEEMNAWVEAGAVAVEMEAAAVMRVAERHGVRAACLLAVTDLVQTRERIDRERLAALGVRLGEVALGALVRTR